MSLLIKTTLDQLTRDLQSVDSVAFQTGLTHSTIRGWRFRFQLGIKIGRSVYFRPDEVAFIEQNTDKRAKKVRIQYRPQRRPKVNFVETQISLRPEMLYQAKRQAAKLRMSLDDYLQLLIFERSPVGWRSKITPPMEFPRVLRR